MLPPQSKVAFMSLVPADIIRFLGPWTFRGLFGACLLLALFGLSSYVWSRYFLPRTEAVLTDFRVVTIVERIRMSGREKRQDVMVGRLAFSHGEGAALQDCSVEEEIGAPTDRFVIGQRFEIASRPGECHVYAVIGPVAK